MECEGPLWGHGCVCVIVGPWSRCPGLLLPSLDLHGYRKGDRKVNLRCFCEELCNKQKKLRQGAPGKMGGETCRRKHGKAIQKSFNEQARRDWRRMRHGTGKLTNRQTKQFWYTWFGWSRSRSSHTKIHTNNQPTALSLNKVEQQKSVFPCDNNFLLAGPGIIKKTFVEVLISFELLSSLAPPWSIINRFGKSSAAPKSFFFVFVLRAIYTSRGMDSRGCSIFIQISQLACRQWLCKVVYDIPPKNVYNQKSFVNYQLRIFLRRFYEANRKNLCSAS